MGPSEPRRAGGAAPLRRGSTSARASRRTRRAGSRRSVGSRAATGWASWPRRPASTGSTWWPGGTSTTPRRAAPNSTPTRSWPGGPKPASTSASGRPGWTGRPARSTGAATRSTAGPGATRSSPARPWPASGSRIGTGDGLVEIWNGMPFFSPLWSRCPADRLPPPRPRRDVEDGPLALPGPGGVRHRTPGGTPLLPTAARSSRCPTRPGTIWSRRLHFSPQRVTVVPPGIDSRFSPGEGSDPDPLVVAVGRLVPVKRFDRFVEAMVALKKAQPRLRAMIVGEGYERPDLEATDRRGRRRRLVLPARAADRRRPGGRVPAGLGGRLDVGPRGLGHDPHRGRRLRHAVRGHPHRRARGRRDRRRVGASWSRRSPSWSRPPSRSWATRCCVAG